MHALGGKSLPALIALAAVVCILVVGYLRWSAPEGGQPGQGVQTVPLELPGWELGSRWVFDLNYPNLSSTQTSEVVGKENLDGVPCYVVEESYSPPLGPIASSKIWVDKSTLMSARTQLLDENDNLLMEQMITRTFSEQLWPLDNGKELTMTENSILGGELAYTLRISGPERLAVPAGEFECLKLAYYRDNRVARTEWYSSQAGWYVKVEGPGVTLELRSYSLA